MKDMNRYDRHLWKIGVLGIAALAPVATAGGCSNGGNGGDSMGLGDLLGDEPITAGSIVGAGIGMVAPPIIGDIGGDLAKHVVDDTVQGAEPDKKTEEMERTRDYEQMRRLKESDPEKYKQMTGREGKPK